MLVGSPDTTEAARVPDTEADCGPGSPRPTNAALKASSNGADAGAKGHFAPASGQSRSRAVSYWVEPWVCISQYDVKVIVLALAMIADNFAHYAGNAFVKYGR